MEGGGGSAEGGRQADPATGGGWAPVQLDGGMHCGEPSGVFLQGMICTMYFLYAPFFLVNAHEKTPWFSPLWRTGLFVKNPSTVTCHDPLGSISDLINMQSFVPSGKSPNLSLRVTGYGALSKYRRCFFSQDASIQNSV